MELEKLKKTNQILNKQITKHKSWLNFDSKLSFSLELVICCCKTHMNATMLSKSVT